MEPFDYLKILVTRWRIIAATVVVAVLVAWFATPAAPASDVEDADSYTATATLVRTPGSEQSMAYIAVFVTSGEVPEAAARELGYSGEPAVLAQSVEVTADDTVGTLTIAVSDPSAAKATRTANAFVDQLVRLMEEQTSAASETRESEQLRLLEGQVAEAERVLDRLDRRVNDNSSAVLQARLAAAQTNFENLLERLDEVAVGAVAASSPLQVVQRATPVPDNSTGFSPPSSRVARVLLAAVGGLALGCALALIVGRIDTRLRRRPEVQAAYGLPVLAEIPSLSGGLLRRHPGPVVQDPHGPVAGAFRSLRSALLLTEPTALGQERTGEPAPAVKQHSGATVLVVASARAGEGRSTTTANLAACLAESGRRVLVIDCDVRNPELHVILGVPEGPGVTDVEGDQIANLVRVTNVPGVTLMQAGMSGRGHVVLPMALPRIVGAARAMADVVLIDCPPMLAGTEAMDAMANADAVLVVCRSGRTSREQAERVRELLTRVRVPVFGVALIGPREARTSSGVSAPGSRSTTRRKRPVRSRRARSGAGASRSQNGTPEPPVYADHPGPPVDNGEKP